MSDATWIVCQTKSRHEKIVARELAWLNIPFELPLETRRRYDENHRRWRSSEVPIFPGYIFPRYASIAQRYLIADRDAVAKLIEVKDQRRFERELGDIVRACNLGLDVSHLCDVRDLAGDGKCWRVNHPHPFAGAEGTVLRIGKRHRLVLQITTLNVACQIEISAKFLEPV